MRAAGSERDQNSFKAAQLNKTLWRKCHMNFYFTYLPTHLPTYPPTYPLLSGSANSRSCDIEKPRTWFHLVLSHWPDHRVYSDRCSQHRRACHGSKSWDGGRRGWERSPGELSGQGEQAPFPVVHRGVSTWSARPCGHQCVQM